MSRTKRRNKTRTKAISADCANHGGCPVCEGNRLYQINKERARCDDNEKELHER